MRAWREHRRLFAAQSASYAKAAASGAEAFGAPGPDPRDTRAMSTNRKLFNSAVARTVSTVIFAVISFFLMPFLIAHLGERWYGIWILVSGLVANSYLLDLGMASAVTRYVARHLALGDNEGANRVISTCLVIYTVLAVVVFAMTLVVSFFAERFVPDPNDLRIIRATIIVIGLQYAAEFPFKAFAGIVSSYVRYDLLMLSRVLNVAITTALMVFFVGRGYGILSMAIIVLAVDQLSNFLYYRIAKHLFRELKVGRAYVTRGLVKELFSYSTWSFVTQLATQVRFRKDAFVIGAMIGASAVTYYSVGLRLVEYLVDFVNRATNMLTPVFTRYYYERNFEELRSKYLFVTRINAVMGLFGGGMLIILGKAFIVRWMGPTFDQSYPILVILTVAMAVELIGVHTDNILYAISKHKHLAIINVIEAVLNLALSIALAIPWGIVGVAVGTALPLLFFRLLVIPRVAGKFIELPLWRYYRGLFPVAGYTLAYLGVFWLLTRSFLAEPSYMSIFLVGLASVPVYVLTIPYIGFSVDERAQLQQSLPVRLRRFTAPLLSR
jgi:O-antigen/teichoic acid export membrane protein